MDRKNTAAVATRSLGQAPDLALGAWHANPLDHAQAEALGARAWAARQAAHRTGHRCFPCHVQEMIARFWRGDAVAADYRALIKAADYRYERALVKLVYGQLLLSRRLKGAIAHLDAGFAEAAPLFGAAEYFTVWRRHGLLVYLPLFDTARPPHHLDDLLTEATVIRRLRGASATRPPYRLCHGDTVG